MKSYHQTVKEKLENVSKLLGIGDYNFKIIVQKSSKNKKCRRDENTYGYVVIDEETRDVIFNINKDLNDGKEMDNTIVHELLHVRLSELLALINVVLDLYVKDKKAKRAYIRTLNHLEHKIIVATTKTITKYGKNK